MNPTEELIRNFQELVAQVPEFVQPFVVMLASTIPFVEGEGGALVGMIGGLNPILVGVAAAAGNFLSVLVVVVVSSKARGAVVDRRAARRQTVSVGAGGSAATEGGYVGTLEEVPAKPESKGRQRVKSWLLRFGVPGASILGPLAIPTQFTSAIFVAGGASRGWVLLWQAVAIALWTTAATVSAWAALTFIVGI
ncbi:small multidrug efflux protein [Mycetocola zhujimingii]|uniref:Small multidrug efflux protein n=1 Tax=Mycetocola zhujimingii TaxID=2079792 RepID=A0A2U1TGW4_9MICO|nr:small multidrug efflux protein [Mycetocola zhujimingii]PWC08080.1 small multidrug efflux protein [Mycetocola zhujimingii]